MGKARVGVKLGCGLGWDRRRLHASEQTHRLIGGAVAPGEGLGLGLGLGIGIGIGGQIDLASLDEP